MPEEQDEHCRSCRFAFGPLFLSCGNEKSEFFECQVHPLGCCPEFTADDGNALVLVGYPR